MASQAAAGKRMGKLRETFLTALTACKEQGVKVDLEELFPGLYSENKAFFDELLVNMLQLLREYSQVRAETCLAATAASGNPPIVVCRMSLTRFARKRMLPRNSTSWMVCMRSRRSWMRLAFQSGASCWRYGGRCEGQSYAIHFTLAHSSRPDPESKTAKQAVNKASIAAKQAEAEALRSVLASVSDCVACEACTRPIRRNHS